MPKFTPLPFQEDAIKELSTTLINLWGDPEMQIPILLKSPTGSGKTFISACFINRLNNIPNWDPEKAYIWITFSDDLAMQSRDKFKEYFPNSLGNNLLTINDINNGKLLKNDILFVNWQKLVSRSAENRILRRPENPEMRMESGVYWEDLIDETHNDNKEIILVVDEIHKNRTTALAQEIIDYINPKVIYGISATPSSDDELNARRKNSFIEVPRHRVVEEGLIKEKIIVTPNEELRKHEGEDLDQVLLNFGVSKREELKKQYKELGKKINPLVLIQLPNDDNSLIERGEKTKEEIASEYLHDLGIEENKIAKWFTGHEKPDFLEENDDEHEYLLFKQAAGTGWDCPRAHVLIMFREITSSTFYAQTVGRILRMAEPHKIEDYLYYPDLRTGFLYTNYSSNDINGDYQNITGNKPYIHKSKIKEEFQDYIEDFKLESSFLSRVDYGDLADSVRFQVSFIKSMNEYFGITERDNPQERKSKLTAHGVDIGVKVYSQLLVNAEISDIDKLALELQTQGKNEKFEMSQNDIEKTFNFLCYKLLTEQTDEEAKISNVSRSWSTFKSAIRVWFGRIFDSDVKEIYSVFIHDVFKEASSVFRPAITKSLKDYRPILNSILQERYQSLMSESDSVFRLNGLEYQFTDDYIEVPQEFCVMDKCYIRDYSGKRNEIEFIKYIDGRKDYVFWWFKNGDSGKDAYSLKYFNVRDQKDSLFFPDWIIKFMNGKTGIFDTKAGTTLNTQGRASALGKKIIELGDDYIGGIVRFANGIWEYCNSDEYNDMVPAENDWKPFESIFRG